jgi:hypothetical protein
VLKYKKITSFRQTEKWKTFFSLIDKINNYYLLSLLYNKIIRIKLSFE